MSFREIGTVQTDLQGQYSSDSVEAGSAERVVPVYPCLLFTPSWAEFTVNGDLGQDFSGYFRSGF